MDRFRLLLTRLDSKAVKLKERARRKASLSFRNLSHLTMSARNA
jgi:hypothetical protein